MPCNTQAMRYVGILEEDVFCCCFQSSVFTAQIMFLRDQRRGEYNQNTLNEILKELTKVQEKDSLRQYMFKPGISETSSEGTLLSL